MKLGSWDDQNILYVIRLWPVEDLQAEYMEKNTYIPHWLTVTELA